MQFLGLRDRHWKQISEALGAEVKHDDSTSLHDMIEVSISRFFLRKLLFSVKSISQIFFIGWTFQNY